MLHSWIQWVKCENWALLWLLTHAIVIIQCKSVMLQHEDSLSWMSWTSCHCYCTDMNTLITASYSWLVWYKVQYTMPWSDKYAWNLTRNETRQNHCKHSWCNQHNINSPNSLAILVCIWIVSQWVGGLKLGIVVVYVCGKQFPNIETLGVGHLKVVVSSCLCTSVPNSFLTCKQSIL